MASLSVIIGGLPDGRLCGQWMADLTQRHLAECAHEAALPFGR
jgi:hypothetical protein